ncbi:MFS transporter [Denitratisoma oestradiolicum]|uniref:MFS transporter n=1 Tax=Denitratisoma oestradiolicum TaxID=311182 RepID=A0A6S6XVD4_9PROT|nr:MFS transporter [Denitratisoma oestradiolicum]TWO79585.1 MFS transporter [Denitratisoma oestradiolicum]CAB1368017.1 MFS transporter [Denitratisoma oestradiolicum]
MSSASSIPSRWQSVGLVLAVAAYVLSFFHRAAPAAIAADLQGAFQISAAQLGNLAATYFYVYTVMQLPTGVLVDTLGCRRVLVWGGVTAGLGSLLLGLAPSFEWALAGRTLVGLGVSVAFIAMLKLIATDYDESRFASMVGLGILLANLGSVAAGAPLAWLAQAIGWRTVFLAVGGLSLALALLSRFGIREVPRVRGDRTVWLGGLWRVMSNRATWPGFFANLGLAGAFFAFAGLWAVPYLTQVHGMGRGLASTHVSVYFIGYACGAALWGQVSDRLGRRRPVMIGVSGAHALLWWVWLMGSLPLWGSLLLCCALGLCSAGFTLSWACAKEVNPVALSGMATGLVNVGCFLGASILQPLFGWVMDLGWQGAILNGARLYSAADYANGIRLLALAALMGWCATFFIRETRCRNISGELK